MQSRIALSIQLYRHTVELIHTSAPLEDTQGQGEVLNLSLKGCAVQSEAAVTTRLYLALQLYLPGDATPVTIDEAVVRWVSFQQFGVEFTRILEDARQRLRQVIGTL